MNRMKRILPLMLALALILALLAGCGTGGESSKSAAASQSAAKSEPAAQPEKEDAPAPAPETDPEAAPQEDGAVEDNSIDFHTMFPLAEEKEYSVYYSTSPDVASALDLPNDFVWWHQLEDMTNIYFDFWMYSLMDRESTNVLIGSGELPDIMLNLGFTNAGYNSMDKVLDDELVLDLTDYMDLIPNYQKLRLADDTVRRQSVTSSGRISSIYGIYEDGNTVAIGPFVRQDWLDALSLESPVTYDQYEQVLTAFKTEYNPNAAIYVSPVGYTNGNYLSAGYGVAVDTSMSIQGTYYAADGKVLFGPMQDAYKDYLTMLNRWYQNGLLGADFMAKPNFGAMADAADVTSGQVGIFVSNSQNVNLFSTMMEDAEFSAVRDARLTEDQQLHLMKDAEAIGQPLCLNSGLAQEDVEIILTLVNWWYSDEGYIFCNYGVEGDTFEYVDGKPMMSDKILKSPEEYTSIVAMSKYLWANNGAYYIAAQARQAQLVDPAYQETWSLNSDNSYYMNPTILSKSDEQGAVCDQHMGDVNTYYEENAVKFIIGEKSFDEWDAYVEQLKTLGVELVIEALQGAYDDYMAR